MSIIGKVYEVSEVTALIKKTIEDQRELYSIQIKGEVSNFKRYPSGHCYFTLKDSYSLLKVVMFKSKADRLEVFPKNGESIVVLGKIGVYERDGVYQLYADFLVKDGIGKLQRKYEFLKDKLEKKGFFKDIYKKKLPQNPKVIGIITSSKGAAIHDIIAVSRARNPGVKLILFPVKVQGEFAAKEISFAINYMDQKRIADVIIVGRGGGSLEDLWAFNEEIVVESIFNAKTPIVSAVGHEVDFSLSDFVADKRAATPSNAAEILVSDNSKNYQHLLFLKEKNEKNILMKIRNYKDRVTFFEKSIQLNSPLRIVDSKRQFLDYLSIKNKNCMENALEKKSLKYENLNGKLEVLNPLSIFKRGYSIMYNKKNQIVKSVDDLKKDDETYVRLIDGVVHLKVLDKES